LGLFIAFEGGEGCGKSTQSRLLLKKFERQNIRAVLTHEPGGTALGNELRKALKRKGGSFISPQAELFLVAASRAQLVAEVIRPALEEGRVVICDRFTYSTLVYQGYGRGLELSFVEKVNNIATVARKQSLRDRFELEDLSFHRRVREGYLRMVAAESEHWLVIDASLPKEKVAGIIWDRVSKLLPDFSA